MLRLDPGEERIATTRYFRVWEGGGEYNVARGLRRCFGLRTAVVTALVENPVGRLVEGFMLEGGVDTSFVRWAQDDSSGRYVRNGLNFTERGFGVRGALGCADRGNTAASQLQPGDLDWDSLFRSHGVRWFHCGGIFAALSESTALVAEEAMHAAREAGAVVSYDLNYRPSLWEGLGGSRRAIEVNRRLVRLVDVLFGNEEDLTTALGYSGGGDDTYTTLEPDHYASMLREVCSDFPALRIAATSLRTASSASVNDWGGICVAGDEVYVGRMRAQLEVFDRVGGGDSFASGFIYGLLTEIPIELALEYGIAHGALAMTTPGDTSMATLAEVEALVAGGSQRIQR